MKTSETIQTVVLSLLLIASLVGAVFLVRQNQEMRRGAYFSSTSLFLQPTSISTTVGQQISIQLWVESQLITGSTADRAKVDFAQTSVCYDSTKLSITPTLSTVVVADPFTDVQLATVRTSTISGYDKCLDVAVSSSKAKSSLKSGAQQIATVKFTAVANGSGTFKVDAERVTASGYNPSTLSNDMSLSIGTIAGGSYSIGSGSTIVNDGTSAVLNYKMAFLGQIPNASCASNWPITITALGNGYSGVYTGITPTYESNSNGKAIYKGSLTLTGFTQKDNVAIFIKGPKHIQVKYGKADQSAMYNKAGGELTLTGDSSTSPTYDFSGYPDLAGDVTSSSSSGTQDGLINGLDFAYIKARALTHNTADSMADLDGDCMATNNDVNIFKISLNEKQGQLY